MGKKSENTQGFRRGNGGGMHARGVRATRETPLVERSLQPTTREGEVGPHGVAERPVVPRKPGNAGRGKGP